MIKCISGPKKSNETTQVKKKRSGQFRSIHPQLVIRSTVDHVIYGSFANFNFRIVNEHFVERVLKHYMLNKVHKFNFV